MTDRQPPPSPAAVRLTRQTAVADMARAGLLAGTLLGPAASAGTLRAISRSKDPSGQITSGALRDALQRPLLPVTAAEEAAMLDEARRQLADSGPVSWAAMSDDGPPSPAIDPRVNCTCGRRLGACTCETVWRMPELQGGWCNADGGVYIQREGEPEVLVFTLPPDYRPTVVHCSPESQAAVAMCVEILHP